MEVRYKLYSPTLSNLNGGAQVHCAFSCATRWSEQRTRMKPEKTKGLERGQGRSRSQVTAANGWIMWNSQKAMTWDRATNCTRWCHMGVGGPQQPHKKSSMSLGSFQFGEHHPRIVSFELCRLSANCGQIWPLLTGCSLVGQIV
jgi:hypothetical protein